MLDDTKEQQQMFREQRFWRSIWYTAELLGNAQVATLVTEYH